MYEKYFKRCVDIVLSGGALLVLWPVLAVVALMVRQKLGSPVIFCQMRPGKDERIFKMYKFRSMTDARDEQGNLLSDDVRLTPFGAKLRATSFDELPELWNIFKGDMSVVGPRPQLVRDMVFMSADQRRRHNVRPGLTGLAQVNGRNAIEWEDKLRHDLEYLEDVSFLNDVKIIFKTVECVFRHDDVSAEGMATAEDLGDYLLRVGSVSREEYDEKQTEAKKLLENV